MTSVAQAAAGAHGAVYRGELQRDLKESDPLQWGEGRVSVSSRRITLEGRRVPPGLDCKFYLSPEFVETEANFQRLKATMRRVGDVKTFENSAVELPEGTVVGAFTTVIAWCDTFSPLITEVRYR